MLNKKTFLHKPKPFIVVTLAIFMALTSANTVNIKGADTQYNYAKALQYSQYFYDANMCGTGVNENSLLPWRNDCHVYDAKLPLDSTNTNMTDSFISANKTVLDPDGDGRVDVSGGFHDAGDHVKFGLPQGYAGSTLGWGFYEFRNQYEASGQDTHAKRILKYFNDYFMKCTYLDSTGKAIAFCYQVGDGDIDHSYWEAPEVDTMFRRGWFATDALPSTDVVSEAAASLAANYMNFKTSDSQYADKNLKYAKALFQFAERNGKGCNADGPKSYYTSSSWKDDYCWAAAWLYLATRDSHYLDELFKYYDYNSPTYWTYCFDNVWNGSTCLLGEINDLYDKDGQDLENRYRTANGKSQSEPVDFWGQTAKSVDKFMSGQMGKITPGGYAFLSQWGSARYNTAAQLLALIYDKHHGDTPSKYSEWAKGQMQYLMGKNPLNRCYIVGYSSNSAKYPHHRAASGLTRCEDTSPQKNVLYGALVGGPGGNDEHIDLTSDYVYNEVAIDYNAGFVGACAGLYHFYGDSSMTVTNDFAQRTLEPSSTPSPTPTPTLTPTPTPTPTLTPTPTPGYPLYTYVFGDLNNDGSINSLDLALMKRYILRNTSELKAPKEVADLNGDNLIDSNDILILKNYLLNRTTGSRVGNVYRIIYI